MSFKRIIAGTLALFGAFILLLTIAGVLIVFVYLPKSKQAVSNKVILELDFEKGLSEYFPDHSILRMLRERPPTVLDTIQALEKASKDPRVLGLIARVGVGDMGLAKIQEIRNAIRAFRQTGKPAVAYAQTFGEFGPGNGAYYLATAFDKIYLQPSGDIGLTGLIYKSPFILGTLEKLGVTPRIDSRGKYKGAADLFTKRKYTDEQKEATTIIMESQFSQITEGIADARGLSQNEVKALVNRGPFSAQDALSTKLIDGLAYRDEVYDSIKMSTDKGAEFQSIYKYWDQAKDQNKGKIIALIYCIGPIHRGKSESSTPGGASTGSDTLSAAFRAAMEDRQVQAILFRVDSPGGSYVASDTIWRETLRTKKAGKPIIVSMSDVAASGGYFVAASATKIVAQPATLTGSIGVFAGKPVTTDFWDKIGVSWDEVHTSDNSTFWSTTDNYSPDQWKRFEQWLDRVYDDFTTKVAAGRNLPKEKVLEAAQGRVWTGEIAQKLGLVDELGGFPEALSLARKAAGIPEEVELRLKLFPQKKSLLESIVDRLLGTDSEGVSEDDVSTLLEHALQIDNPLAALVKNLDPNPGPLLMPRLEAGE